MTDDWWDLQDLWVAPAKFSTYKFRNSGKFMMRAHAAPVLKRLRYSIL